MPTILPPKMLPQMIKGELLTPKSRGWKSPHSNLAPVSPLYIKWTAGKLHLNYTVRKSKRVLWPVALLTRFIYSPFFFTKMTLRKISLWRRKNPKKLKKLTHRFQFKLSSVKFSQELTIIVGLICHNLFHSCSQFLQICEHRLHGRHHL